MTNEMLRTPGAAPTEGYAANGQLLGERRARQALERLRTAKINA